MPIYSTWQPYTDSKTQLSEKGQSLNNVLQKKILLTVSCVRLVYNITRSARINLISQHWNILCRNSNSWQLRHRLQSTQWSWKMLTTHVWARIWLMFPKPWRALSRGKPLFRSLTCTNVLIFLIQFFHLFGFSAYLHARHCWEPYPHDFFCTYKW